MKLNGKQNSSIFLGPEGTEIPQPHWPGGSDCWETHFSRKTRMIWGRGNGERTPRIPGSPQHHGAAQRAHGHVHQPVLVQVQLPVDAAPEIHQARGQVGGRDALERNGNNPGWSPAGAFPACQGFAQAGSASPLEIPSSKRL